MVHLTSQPRSRHYVHTICLQIQKACIHFETEQSLIYSFFLYYTIIYKKKLEFQV